MRKLLSYAIELPRWVKISGFIAVDFIVSLITLSLAIALRYGDFQFHVSATIIVFFAALPIVLLGLTHFYTHVLRVFQDRSMRYVLMVLLACLILGQALIVYQVTINVPRVALAIHMFLLYMYYCGTVSIITQFAPGMDCIRHVEIPTCKMSWYMVLVMLPKRSHPCVTAKSGISHCGYRR